jgi:hypothetical protein
VASPCSPWLAVDQVHGLYPERDGELAYGPGIGSPAQGFELLDSGVRNAGEFAELPLREALPTALRG